MPATGNRKIFELANDVVAIDAANIASTCIVVDEDARIRHFLSLILYGAGVDALEFASGAAFRESGRAGEMVFLGVNDDGNDAALTIATLKRWRFSGAMQLMGHTDAALENLRRIGQQSGLRILPVLRKPFEADTIRKILQAERLGDPPGAAVQVRLDEALKNGWIEVWYQPKIDLRKRQLVGCEAFARIRHPQYGVLPPRAFVSGANDAALRTLAEITLIKALKTGLELSPLGINLRIAINMNMDALVQVPVAEIVKEYRPQPDRWAGLIIDVTEQQLVDNIARLGAVAKHLQACNVKLAVDDFGRGVSSLLKMKDIPFAEMKLDRAFVSGCSTNPLNASICQSAVDLAHSFGSLAVGVGVEKAEDVAALAAMGCDLGQGFLLGQPMAEERFLALLKQRAAARGRTAGA
ncbi:MAG TPA: EAL domain-containing protein [Xanthobacteraceae bacterium]|nr:EAL domain-containing protein [Xanthobacteraceae bacterium]